MATTFKQPPTNYPAGRAVLASGIDDDDTALTLVSGGAAALNTSASYWADLFDEASPEAIEIVLVTNVVGEGLTVTRGQQGTTAQAWDAGTIVEMRLTKQAIADIHTAVTTLEGRVADATAGVVTSTLSVGGGYGSTGMDVGAEGNVRTNGTLLVDGVTTLTGAVTTGGAVNVGGALAMTNSGAITCPGTFNVRGDGNTIMDIDYDNNSGGATFTIRANGSTTVFTVGETGNTTIAGTLGVTGAVTGPTAAAGTNTTQLATTAFVQAASNYGTYQTLMNVGGSHIAGRVAGTYALGYGDPAAVSGTGTLYPIGIIGIFAADYPTVNGLSAKLRIRAQVNCNDVAPTGNFTFGLYPITRPGTSGGAGLCIYTLGTVVSGSNGATVTTPAADSQTSLVGSDFALPTDGQYVIGVVTTATVAASSHVHLTAQLQQHYA